MNHVHISVKIFISFYVFVMLQIQVTGTVDGAWRIDRRPGIINEINPLEKLCIYEIILNHLYTNVSVRQSVLAKKKLIFRISMMCVTSMVAQVELITLISTYLKLKLPILNDITLLVLHYKWWDVDMFSQSKTKTLIYYIWLSYAIWLSAVSVTCPAMKPSLLILVPNIVEPWFFIWAVIIWHHTIDFLSVCCEHTAQLFHLYINLWSATYTFTAFAMYSYPKSTRKQ